MTSTPGTAPTTRTTATLTLVAILGIVLPFALRTGEDLARWLVILVLLGTVFAISLTFRRPAIPLSGDSAARTGRLLLLEAILIGVLGVTGLGASGPANTWISVGQFAVAAVIVVGAMRLFRYARTAPQQADS